MHIIQLLFHMPSCICLEDVDFVYNKPHSALQDSLCILWEED